MRVAYFSPMPPEASGIADYSSLLLPALREHVDLEVVKRGAKRAPRGADLSVYHIGNNPESHGWILDALRRTPGLVVLHDFVLHHLVAGVTIGRRDGHGYLDAMEREHGVVGRLLGHGVLDEPGRSEHRDASGVDLVLRRDAPDPAEVVDVRVRVDDARDGPVPPVLAVQRERGGRRLGGDERVDDDDTGPTLDEGHVRQVEPPDLVDPLHDLEEALLRDEP